MTDKPSPGSVSEAGPNRIYLEPSCCVGPNAGRQWCEDNVWPVDCDDDATGIEYIRADLAARPTTIPASEAAPIGDDLKARWDAAKPYLADDEWKLANDTLARIEELEAVIYRNCDPFDATETDAAIIRQVRATRHAFVAESKRCPKHGLKEQERG